MKTKQIFAVLTALSILLFASNGRAADITAAGSGNWSSTVTNAPWPDGIVPATNDSVYVVAPFNITVDSTATIAFIDGSGTVTMTPGSTLNVLGDPAGGYGTQSLGLLDTIAIGNTVIYSGNAYWCKRQNYYNLVLSGNGTPNNFYNGNIPGYSAVAMTIAGNMTLSGTVALQQGDDITVGGNLSIGSGCSWDCSSFKTTVTGNTAVSGFLYDFNGALGTNILGNVTINSGGQWNITDVAQWSVGGNLTNNGTIRGVGYGSITFNGTGIISGSAFTIPTMTINGTYTIGTTITLKTNTPTINGTVVFDLANTNQIVLNAGTNWLWYTTNGTLDVINSGAEPAVGNSFQLFKASNNNYGGGFASISLPPLSGGHIWVDNLLASGSIAVAAGGAGRPIITLSQSGGLLTLSWDSTTFPGYSVQAQTNSAGIGSNWSSTGSGTNSPFTIAINPANPAVFFRLSNP